jgi:hypothetical protein
MNANKLTITPRKLISVNKLANETGFKYSVRVSEKLLKKVTLFNTRDISVFLKVCANQLNISLTDCKNWQKTRLFYPMPCFDGSLLPEEIIITTQNGDVSIYFAFEDAEDSNNSI